MYQFLYTDVHVVEGYKKSKFYEPLKDLESIYMYTFKQIRIRKS